MNLVEGRSTAGTPSTSFSMRIRAAIAQDREFAMSLVPRLVASTLVPWRSPRKLFAVYVEVISSILCAPRAGAALLVAEDGVGAALGCVLLTEASDCYTHRRRGHLAQAAIAKDRDRSIDVGALIAMATAWGRSRGFRVLTPAEFLVGHPAWVLGNWSVGCRDGAGY